MNMRSDASRDVHYACDAKGTTVQLRLPAALQGCSFNAGSGRLFRRLTAGLGLGTLLVFGSAAAPALADAAQAPASTQELGLAPVSPIDGIPLAVVAETAAAGAEKTGATVSLTSADAGAEIKKALAAGATGSNAERDPKEILQFGAMRVQRWIVETIVRASEITGADPVYMMALADKESSFIPANKASTSSAEGLFQFISSTWLEVVRNYGAKHGLEVEAAAVRSAKGKLSVADAGMRDHILRLRRDPYLSALMAGEMMKRDRKLIERRIGRSIERSEFYLAHFLGADSAGKLMALVDDKPQQSASSVFPAAARANKSLFYAKNGRKTRHLSVAEVYEKIDGMMEERMDRYESVSSKVADARF